MKMKIRENLDRRFKNLEISRGMTMLALIYNISMYLRILLVLSINRELVCSTHHMLQTVLHMLQITLGYALMLIAMTFNLWLFLAVVCGLTLGYFLCGWKHQTVNYNEECCA